MPHATVMLLIHSPIDSQDAHHQTFRAIVSAYPSSVLLFFFVCVAKTFNPSIYFDECAGICHLSDDESTTSPSSDVRLSAILFRLLHSGRRDVQSAHVYSQLSPKHVQTWAGIMARPPAVERPSTLRIQ